MSVRILKSSLQPEHLQLIRKCLFMQPKEPFKRFNKFNFNKGPTKEPIEFYISTTEYIDLPMAFAAALTQQLPNRNLKHYKLSKEELAFKKDCSLYPKQVEVGKTALEYLNNYGGVHLGLYTGFGKTIMSTWLSCQLGYLTLVFMNRTPLIKQWKKSYTDFTNAKIWVVGEKFPPVSDGNYISVILCMNGRFHNIPQQLVNLIGTVIVDESHNFCTKGNVNCLLGTKPRYFISCSATLKRDDGMENMITSIIGNKNEIHRHYSEPFNFYEYKTGISVSIHKNSQGTTDFSRLITDLCECQERNKIITDLILQEKDKKILVLTGRVNHCKRLFEILKEKNENVDFLAGKKNLYNDSRVLLGTYDKIGEGFDEANFCDDYKGIRLNMLILCTTFKSIKRLTQTCGRVFRAQMPTIYDMVDEIKLAKTHFSKRKKWYKERNGLYHRITLNK